MVRCVIMYDKATTAEIINSLGGFSGKNVMEYIDDLPEDLQNDFKNTLFEKLSFEEYASETVVHESLEEAGKFLFKGMNYQIKRGIENDYNLYGKEYTLEKYLERSDNYKTANSDAIKNYITYIQTLDNIEFFF